MKKAKKKNKEKKRGINELLEVPSGIVSGFVLEIYSGKEAVLTGDAEVLELSDSKIKLKCGKNELTFAGDKINISYYTNDGIKIDGKITSLEME